MRGVAHDFGLARGAHQLLAAKQVVDGGGGDGRPRPQRVDRNSGAAQFAGEAQHRHAHAEFRHGIGGMRGEPFFLHVERRRQHQHMRIGGLGEIGHSQLRRHVGAARVDLVHQVETLHVELLAAAERYGAGVVDDNVNSAEFFGGLRQGCRHLGLVAHVHRQRQGFAAGGLDFRGRSEDRAGQLGIRLRRLGGDGDIRAVARRSQGYGEANATRRAGDEKGLARKISHDCLRFF